MKKSFSLWTIVLDFTLMNSSLIGVYNLDSFFSDQEIEDGQVDEKIKNSMVGTLRLFKQIKDNFKIDENNRVNFSGLDTESSVHVEALKSASKDLDHRVGKQQDSELLLYSNVNDAHLNEFDEKFVHDRDTILLLSIPDYQTPQDFLLFMGGIHRQNLLHVRLLFEEDKLNYTQSGKSGKSRSSRFMMLFKFKSSMAAEPFFSEFNGKLFTSFENDICHLVWIDRIIFVGHQDDSVMTSTQKGANLPFLFPSQSSATSSPSSSLRPIQAQLQGFTFDEVGVSPLPDSNLSTDTFIKPSNQTLLSQHLSNNEWIEMPTCPVCLDRLDSSVTGLFTSLCNHTFHCSCIIKWDDTTCPICRFHSFGASMDLEVHDESREPLVRNQGSSTTVCAVCSIR